MQTEGDVDGVLIHKAFQARHAGTLELCLGSTVPNMHPAYGLIGIAEVHGCGLPRAGRCDGRHLRPIQVCRQDVLGVGNQQHRGPVYWLWGWGREESVQLRPLDFSGHYPSENCHCRCLAQWPQAAPPTVLGLAGAVVRLQQVTFNTATSEGAICVGAQLAAGAIY